VLSEQEDAARGPFRQEVSDLKVKLAEVEKQMWADLAQLAVTTEIAE
jgi:hypothetical protein